MTKPSAPRIVHICNKGDETRTLRRCEYLQMCGYENIIVIGSGVFPHRDPLVFRDTYQGMKRFTINHSVTEYLLWDALMELRPDILHIDEMPLAWALLINWTPNAIQGLSEGKGSYHLADAGAHRRKPPCKIVVDWHEYDQDRPIAYAHRNDWEETRRQIMLVRGMVDGETFVAPEFALAWYQELTSRSEETKALDTKFGPGGDRRLPYSIVYNAGPRPPKFDHIDLGMLQIRPPNAGKKRILYPGNASRERRIHYMAIALKDRGLDDRWEMACATKPGMFRPAEWPKSTVMFPFLPWPSFCRPSPEFYAMHKAAPHAVYLGGDTRFKTWKYAWPNKFSDSIFAGVPVIAADMIPVMNRIAEFPSLGTSFADLDGLEARLREVYDRTDFAVKEEERREFIERYCYERSSGPAIVALYDQLGFRSPQKIPEPSSAESCIFDGGAAGGGA